MKNKTKIIFLVSEFLPGPGGIGNQAYCLSKYLSQSDFELIIIAPNRLSFNSKSFDAQEKIRILRYSESSFLKFFQIISLISKQYLENKGAVLISSGLIPLIIIGLLSKFFNSKKIVIFHGHETLIGNIILKQISKYSIRGYDKIIAVSNFSSNFLNKINLKNKINVLNNGFDLKRFKMFDVQKRKCNSDLVLITLGSLSDRKGQHNVIKALPLLRKHYKRIKYHMVGPDNIKRKILDLAISLNVQDLIHFHGYLDDKSLSELFSVSDIFIMLSENLPNGEVEGFGIAILEANYFGLPAIGSKGCGIEDAIQNEETGYLIDNHSPVELKNAVEKIMDNYHYFSIASKEWSKKNDWSIVSKKYIKLIQNL